MPLRPRLTSGNRSSSKAVQIQTPAGDTERMDESDQDRRVRVVVDVTRRPPTDDERERRAEAVRRTPNAIGGPFEAVWSWSVSFEDPSGSHVAGGGTMQSAADERLERSSRGLGTRFQWSSLADLLATRSLSTGALRS